MPSGSSAGDYFYTQRKRCRLWSVATVAALALLFSIIPVTRDFNYEYAVAWSLLLFFAALFLPLLDTGRSGALCVFLLFALPLIIGFSSSALRGINPAVYGLWFYTLFVLPAFSLGLALNSFWASVMEKSAFGGKLLSVLLVLVPPAVELYANPQIYFYNAVVAYFPGTIYDEYIDLSQRLLLHRAAVLAGSIFLFAVSLRLSRVLRQRSGIAAVVMVAVFGLVYFSLSRAGYTTTSCTTERYLSVQVPGARVTCFFAPSTPPARRASIARYANYAVGCVHEFFGNTQSRMYKLYVYESAEQKARLYGTGSADMAKPWLNTAFITADSPFETIRHELAHLAAAGFGSTVFKVASGFNPALIEGAAVAAAPWHTGICNDSLAAFGIEAGVLPDPTSVFSGFSFFSVAPAKSYVVAGSVLSFILRKYGSNTLRWLYQTGEMPGNSGVSLEEAVSQYRGQVLPRRDTLSLQIAAFYFSRPGFVEKQFPRYAAYVTHKAKQAAAQGLWNTAEHVYHELLQYDTSVVAVLGLAGAMMRAGKPEMAINYLKPLTQLYKAPQARLAALLARADAYALANDTARALQLLRQILSDAALPAYYAAAEARCWLVKQGIAASYLAAPIAGRGGVLQAFPTDSLPLFLLLQQLEVWQGENNAMKAEEAALSAERQISAICVSLASTKKIPYTAWRLPDWYRLQFARACIQAGLPSLAIRFTAVQGSNMTIFSSALQELNQYLTR